MRTKAQILTACLISLLLVHPPVSAEETTPPPASLDWQERMLLYPTPSQLSAEQDGRISIYDSLEYSMVDQALNLHFDRMENIHPHSPPTTYRIWARRC